MEDNCMLTATQREVWNFMRKFQETNGKPPTLDEIASAVDSLAWRSGPHYHLHILVAEGYAEITGEPGTSRRYMAVQPESVDVEVDLVAHFIPTERL
jgi:SOS-response transcriptional repressor LexA